MKMPPISDYTEKEFIDFVTSICNGQHTEEDLENVQNFRILSEHPDGSDLLFYPKNGSNDSSEAIVQEIGEPGFKPE